MNYHRQSKNLKMYGKLISDNNLLKIFNYILNIHR